MHSYTHLYSGYQSAYHVCEFEAGMGTLEPFWASRAGKRSVVPVWSTDQLGHCRLDGKLWQPAGPRPILGPSQTAVASRATEAPFP